MEKCNYECYNCRYFHRYFVIKKAEYERTKFGFCRKKRENVGIHGKCEQFKFKQILYDFDIPIQRKLDGLLTEISALRTIVEEEAREYAERKKL